MEKCKTCETDIRYKIQTWSAKRLRIGDGKKDTTKTFPKFLELKQEKKQNFLY